MGHGQRHIERKENDRRGHEKHQKPGAEGEVASGRAGQLDQKRSSSRSCEQKEPERQRRRQREDPHDSDREQWNEDEVRDQGPKYGAGLTERAEDLPDRVG